MLLLFYGLEKYIIWSSLENTFLLLKKVESTLWSMNSFWIYALRMWKHIHVSATPSSQGSCILLKGCNCFLVAFDIGPTQLDPGYNWYLVMKLGYSDPVLTVMCYLLVRVSICFLLQYKYDYSIIFVDVFNLGSCFHIMHANVILFKKRHWRVGREYWLPQW